MSELLSHQVNLISFQLQQFSTYYYLLIDWNKRLNLTAITEKDEVYLKHFYDSITPAFYLDFSSQMSVCDIGSGAGFPSIPLMIVNPHIHVTIIDSLKKRITFLEELKIQLNLKNLHLVHGRAEDIGKMKQYRETFDIVVARAVAKLNVLAEYCLPFCKVSGYFIALKGSLINEEVTESLKAIKQLGGLIEQTHSLKLPIEHSERTIIKIKKQHNTPKKYPRKAGTPVKSPL